MSTHSLVTKENPQKPRESATAYADRLAEEAREILVAKKKLTPDEEQELTKLEQHLRLRDALHSGGIPESLVDKDMQPFADRLRREFVDQYGDNTPAKRVLIDRLIAAWGMAWSYELMFRGTKYKIDKQGYQIYDYSSDKMRFIRETRHGMESANDQILRLTQALENLCHPPVQVKAKNAFFAQNQQFNQNISSKDLADHPKRHHADSSSS